MAEKDEIIKYIKRAFELKEQQCYKQAIEMLYKAIVIEPDNVEILYQIGELYYLLNNYTRAVQYPEQILEMDNNHILALKLLKNIYEKQDKFCSAKEIAEKIYALEPNEDNLISLIEIYGKLTLFDEMEKYKDIINKSEKCLSAYAKICYVSHKTENLINIIQKGLEINPENEDLKILQGKIYFDNNEFEKSKEIFLSFSKNTENSEILNYYGLFSMEDHDYISAIKYFSRAFNIDNKNSSYAYNLSNAYYLNGWLEEAITTYKKALYLAPDNIDYRYSLAYAYYAQESYEKAKHEIDFILNQNKDYAGAKVLKALIKYKEKDFLEAEKILKSNIINGKTDDFTLSALSKVEYDLGKLDKSKEYLTILTENNPNDLNYKLDLSNVYIKLKEYALALDLINTIIKENPNYIEGYITGAHAAFLTENYEKTKEYAQEALSIDINCAAGYYYLSLVRKQEKDYEEAIECMKRAILYDITNAKYYAEMAEIYKLIGDNKSAFEYVKEAENIDNSEEYKILYKEYANLNRK